MDRHLASGRHSLMSKAGALLVALVVIVALVGCTEGPVSEYDLNISASDGGSVTSPGLGSYTYEFREVVTLVAGADQGYQFVNWTGDVDTIDDVDAAGTTITMRADYSITANFEPAPIIQCDLTVSSTAGGSVTAPGEGVFTYESDTVVDLVAVAGQGYQFVNWTGDVDTIDDVDAAGTTIAMRADYSITANFEPAPIVQCDLTVSSTAGGSVAAPGEGVFTYDSDTVVHLVAVADECYEFTGWTGDTGGIADPGSATTTITMQGDYTIRANFAIIRYDLTIDSTEGGSVTAPGEAAFTYDCGQVVDLVAVSDECYEFTGWTGDTGGIADPGSATTTITMDGDYSITAGFARLRYQLTLSSTGFGSVTGPGEGTFTYDCGTPVDLVASPVVRCRLTGWEGDVEGMEDIHDPQATVRIDSDLAIIARFEVIPMVTAGLWHTLGLKPDGTLIATGYNVQGQCNIADWTDIVQVAAGERHTIGLRADGTVIAAGGNDEGQCNVEDWTDIVQVDAGRYFAVGLRSNGTVVAAGCNQHGQCEVAGWTDIVRIATGFYHTLGIKADGTVVAVGFSGHGRLEVGGWTDIVRVGAGGHHSLGLRSDGTVLAVGQDNYGETNVGSWAEIVQVAGGCQASVGLKSDGTIVHSGWCEHGQCLVGGWSNIIQVDAGMVHTVGLKADGTVVAVGGNNSGQCNVDDWVLG